jgi:hypothetical protein
MHFLLLVMPGLVPGIHVFHSRWRDVDGRDKPGHDGMCGSAPANEARARYSPSTALAMMLR